jgi:hypothetical protein
LIRKIKDNIYQLKQGKLVSYNLWKLIFKINFISSLFFVKFQKVILTS